MKGVLAKQFPAPFKGVMVGNGVTNAVGDYALIDSIDFLYGHALISANQYAAIINACPNPNKPDSKCNDLVNKAQASLNDMDPYFIYTDCFHQRHPNGSPCDDSSFATEYLNRADVQAAIHVKKTKWEICSNRVNENYDGTGESMVPIYKFLLSNNLRVLIYSGDSDSVVPYTGTAFWTSNSGFTPQGDEWRPWSFDDALGSQGVAGFVTDYKEGISFATVKGAGHMVPQFKPIPALVMFQRFLAGQKL